MGLGDSITGRIGNWAVKVTNENENSCVAKFSAQP